MDTAHRRMEIISILSAKGHVTMAELAWELETLCRLYGKSGGKEKEILSRIIHKYGADKLEI